MTNISPNPKELYLYDEVIKAARCGNVELVNRKLDCKKRSDKKTVWYRNDLLRSSNTAKNLLHRYISQCDQNVPYVSATQQQQQQQQLLHEELRALLLIYKCYETPWIAIQGFICNCSHFDSMTLFSSISAIQVFIEHCLDDVALAKEEKEKDEEDMTAPPVNDNSHKTSSRTILPLLQQTCQTLIEKLTIQNMTCQNSMHEGGENKLGLLSGLLLNILSLMKCLDDNMFQSTVQPLLEHHPSPSILLQWLHLISNLIPLISPDKADSIANQFIQYVKLRRKEIPTTNLSALISQTIKLASTSLHIELDETDQQMKANHWLVLSLHFLGIADNECELYQQVENHFFNHCKMLFLTKRQHHASMISSIAMAYKLGGIADWIAFNTTLNLIQSIHEVPNRRGRMSRTDCRHHAVSECTKFHLELAFPTDSFQHLISSFSENFGDDAAWIVEISNGLKYTKAGTFVDQAGHTIESLTAFGTLVRRVIFDGNQRSPAQSVSDRPQEKANQLFRGAEMDIPFDGSTHKKTFFMLVITVVTYFELPRLRGEIIHKVLDELEATRGTFLPSGASQRICAVVGVISRSRPDETADYLGPLCNVLSADLSPPVFGHLCMAMSPIAEARGKILIACERFLMPFGYSRSGKPTQLEGIEVALLGLLELVRMPVLWGETEVKAWKRLSDIIVLDVPCIPATVRPWLYRQIQDLAQHGDISNVLGVHLLRALVVRASSVLLFYEKAGSASFRNIESQRNLPEDRNDILSFRAEQLEEILPLHELIQTLITYAWETDDDTSCTNSTRFQKRSSSVLQYVMDLNKKPKRNVASLRSYIPDLSMECQDDVAVCCDIWTSCILRSLQHLTCQSLLPSAKSNGSIKRRHGSTYSQEETDSSMALDQESEFTEAIARILSRETAQLVERCTIPLPNSSRPKWLAPSRLVTTKHDDTATTNQAPLYTIRRLNVIDFVVRFLINQTISSRQSNTGFKQFCSKVVTACGYLLRAKRAIINSDAWAGIKNQLQIPETDNLLKVAPTFFAVSSTVVGAMMVEQVAVDHFDDVIYPVMYFCKTTKFLSQSHDVDSEKGFVLLESLWALYQSLVGEQAAKRLVRYLERKQSTLEGNEKDDDYEYLDEQVQQIRLHVMHSIDECLQHLSSTNEYCFPDFSPITSSHCNMRSVRQVVEFRADIISALSNDLLKGLEGESGGITPELFLAYLSSIDECAVGLFESLMVAKGDINTVSLVSFLATAKNLVQAISSFHVEDAGLFRASFIIATAALPSMSRELLRRCLCQKDPLPCELHEFFFIERSFRSTVLDDCLAILGRWSSLRDPNAVRWSDIAREQNYTKHDESAEDTSEGTPTINVRKRISQACTVSKKQTRIEYKINMSSKERWSWSLSCGLVALEETWAESHRVMSSIEDWNDLPGTLFSDGDIPTHWFRFWDERKIELQSALRYAARFFESSSINCIESDGRKLALEMFATNLPSAPRQRLCSLVGTMTRVLLYGTQVLHSGLTTVGQKVNSIEKKNALSEATSTISAWLHCNDVNDFAEGVHAWMSIVDRKQRNDGGSITGNVAGTNTDLLRRLTNVVDLLGELTSNLEELKNILLNEHDKEENNGSIMEMLFLKEGPEVIIHLVDTKIQVLQRTLPDRVLRKKTTSLPDFPNRTVEQLPSVRRKRQRRTTTQRRSKPTMNNKNDKSRGRRKTMRPHSRNPVVDIFMHLDNEQDHADRDGSTTGSRGRGYYKKDAYVDLEDFLVEG